MKVLVIGSGGREHAIVYKLKQSSEISELFCAPGNAGIAHWATCVPLAAIDVKGVVAFCREQAIDFVVVTPDNPLALGMVDALEAAGIAAFGPTAKAAEIESSKVFSKGLMKKYDIPTAAYEVFEQSEPAYAYLQDCDYPVVIKADGLALGKGVVIAQNVGEARAAVKSMMQDHVFGTSGSRIVVEEFLTGPEVSVLAFTDGTTMLPMVSSMDHKRALDGDKGLNTGGMGVVAPNPYYTKEMAERCMQEIFLPTMQAMNQEGRTFKGCLYFGLMLTPKGPAVIEYNCRFGDPEAQAVLPLLQTDLLTVLQAVRSGTLAELALEWQEGACACVVLASGGYPEAYQTGLPIEGLTAAGESPDAQSIVFHAGTGKKADGFVTAGGRVLCISSVAETLQQALQAAYHTADGIHFRGKHLRHDIGKAALQAITSGK